MILIVSHQKDGHNLAIQSALQQMGHEFAEIDLAKFPSMSSLTLQYQTQQFEEATLQIDDKEISFNSVGAIWWRRPQGYTLHPDLKGSLESNFSYNECICAINGLWMLTDANWINHPVNDEVASRKAYQLKVAAKNGLLIPKTCITNDPEQAKQFIESLGDGNVIYKSFSATEQAWRETRQIKKEEIENLNAVKYAPVIFQECIHSDIDLRVTIIGNHIFPAAIHSLDTSYKYDFRMNYHEAKIVHHELPEKLQEQLLSFMREMGIIYGAVDLRLKQNGEYIFLEVNTAGQWLFMEEPTGMPITNTLAQTLAEYDHYFAKKNNAVLAG
ncbi:MAG: hypothetical protein H7Y00_16260 [Fimbriimonadaceae bacterium]|nr:hypothetical protein [Chitinophagales bacterium]